MNFLDYKDKIVCASKYFSVEDMNKIYELGIKDFAENYVQDLLKKKENFNKNDVKWHLIGHLQTNKVKDVINEIDCFHALDSLRLAKMIEKHRIKPLNCFIQVNLSQEIGKNGINVKEIDLFLKELKIYDKINVIGFMTIGVHEDDLKTELVFKQLNELKHLYGLAKTSMGMSNDYEIAIKYESDYLRIGSLFKGVI